MGAAPWAVAGAQDGATAGLASTPAGVAGAARAAGAATSARARRRSGAPCSADGDLLLHYAIADVGAHVVPGGALDRDTRERVETIYCPDKRVGLHPPQMSEGFASLLPGQRTKAVLWTLDVDRDGNLAGFDARRAWVRSRRQYAYHELATSPPAEARDLVTALREFGQARRAALRKLGAVTLPRPSQEAVVEDGKVSLEFRASLDVEDDNAQVSLLTGMAAARCMLKAGVGILRTMPAASPEALQRLRRQAAALGMAWPDAWTYVDMLDHLDPGAPRTAAFLTEAGALFRGARWEAFDSARGSALAVPANTTHGALAAPYAHVTAPLRRLVDRYDAEICLALCAGREVPAWALEALAWIGGVMAAGVGRSQRVDTACVDAVERVIERRWHEVMQLQRQISLERNRRWLGRELKVLVEGQGASDDGAPLAVGRSFRDAPEVDGQVFVWGRAPAGSLITARVTKALEYDLWGEIAS